MTDAYKPLGELLTQMQHELWAREWPENPYERIKLAADFRGKLFEAICAFRDAYPSFKVAS